MKAPHRGARPATERAATAQPAASMRNALHRRRAGIRAHNLLPGAPRTRLPLRHRRAQHRLQVGGLVVVKHLDLGAWRYAARGGAGQGGGSAFRHTCFLPLARSGHGHRPHLPYTSQHPSLRRAFQHKAGHAQAASQPGAAPGLQSPVPRPQAPLRAIFRQPPTRASHACHDGCVVEGVADHQGASAGQQGDEG